MSYAVVVTKIDPQTKRQAQETAKKMGLSLSAVIKAFLKQFVRTKTVTFSAEEMEEITDLSSEAERKFKKAVADIKAGRNIYKPRNKKEFFNLLNS